MARPGILEPGQIIRFMYLGKNTVDQHKEALILHPNWQNKVHAIDLKRCTPAEAEVLTAVFDPNTKKGEHRLPLVNDVLNRMDPLEESKNPVSFYQKFVKPFMRTAGDCYRTYERSKMITVVVVKESSVSGQVFNPNPLFKK